MPAYYSFPQWPASEECPAVPRSVRVWGDATVEGTKNDLGAALKVLARALRDDPSLEREHPDFLAPEERPNKPAPRNRK